MPVIMNQGLIVSRDERDSFALSERRMGRQTCLVGANRALKCILQSTKCIINGGAFVLIPHSMNAQAGKSVRLLRRGT